MKNSNDTIGNRTRDLPACSAVPQPTAPPRTPGLYSMRCKKAIYERNFNAESNWKTPSPPDGLGMRHANRRITQLHRLFISLLLNTK